MAWRPGMKVVHRAQRTWGVGIILQVADDGRRLAVRFAGRDGITVVSGRDPALAEVPAETPVESSLGGPLDLLASGTPGPPSAFSLRTRVLALEALRRADSLGALLSSRVHVLPHQVGAAGRVLADRVPRFVLADEVGLGKTVEAGLVFAGLRQLGIADRVLIVVPEHLGFQWLAELFHKFNSLFALLTRERIGELGGPLPALTKSPWAIVSHEALRADEGLALAAAALAADLVIVDEAHHLDDDALYEAVAPICRSAFGLLLLTATPVRLDPSEYFRLLSLVEPVPSTSLPEFLLRLERHEAYAEVARGLLGGEVMEKALSKLRSLAPGDPFFERGDLERETLLNWLADRYGLSGRLIRNRRVKVGAFTSRVLRREDVAEGKKREAQVRLCASLASRHEKVLVFGGELKILREIQTGLAHSSYEALLYDDATTIEARDRLVARFRDPEGPMVLLSGESGGEGRNFQFACHLVCADLPTSPLVLEQRIGRLDRLGQRRPVEIHLVIEPGEEAFLADLYEREIGIFDEPVGGLDTVLASLPSEIEALSKKRGERTRQAFRNKLAARVSTARRAQHAGDPLLDLRSASLPELTALVRGGFERMGEDPPGSLAEPESLGLALETLSRWLEEELESVAVEVGERVGMDVDTDKDVHPFEVAFTLGSGMQIEALPGMVMPEEPVTHLGSFWRATAVARDELEWFATGHRLVEALLGIVRDGDAGRSAVVRLGWAPRRGALYVRFEPRLPTPQDLAPGARVGSRQASRYVELSPISVMVELESPHRMVAGGADRFEKEAEELEEARVEPAPLSLIEAACGAAEALAREELSRRVKEASQRLNRHARAEEERLAESVLEGGASRERVDAALGTVRNHREVVEKTLERVNLGLDAAALVVP